MWRVLAAVVHLGNIEFADDAAGLATITNMDVAVVAARLLGTDRLPLKLVGVPPLSRHLLLCRGCLWMCRCYSL
jgi:hypothetical protein